MPSPTQSFACASRGPRPAGAVPKASSVVYGRVYGLRGVGVEGLGFKGGQAGFSAFKFRASGIFSILYIYINPCRPQTSGIELETLL